MPQTTEQIGRLASRGMMRGVIQLLLVQRCICHLATVLIEISLKMLVRTTLVSNTLNTIINWILIIKYSQLCLPILCRVHEIWIFRRMEETTGIARQAYIAPAAVGSLRKAINPFTEDSYPYLDPDDYSSEEQDNLANLIEEEEYFPEYESDVELKWTADKDSVVLRALWLQVLTRIGREPGASDDERDWGETGFENPPWYGVKKVDYDDYASFLSAPEAFP